MTITRGRVVQTPSMLHPYKVVFGHKDQVDTEHSVETMREGEALIRKKMPKPPKRDTSRDNAGF
jgi:hypothetical protein